ncbi:MAG TPA: primosomal protein N' [Kofleriaceae bacterium]|nr:primosomal protein N' [Kofleriaceae bacterium]
MSAHDAGTSARARNEDRALVEVAVSLPVAGMFHYRVPARLDGRAGVGARVLVPFGARQVSGVIVRAPAELVAPGKVLEVADIVGDDPLPPDLVALCVWIAEYYEAPIGEALRAAVPAGTQVTAADVVAPTETGVAAAAGEGAALPPKQRDLLAQIVHAGRLPRAKIARARHADLDALAKRGLVTIGLARSAARIKPQTERVARLAVPVDEALARLARAPKRMAIVQALADGPRAIAELAAQIPGASAAVRELANAGAIVVEKRELVPEAAATPDLPAASTPPVLTAQQRAALDAITAAASRAPIGTDADQATRGGFAAFLVHGVTGSGKTEVYLHAIAHALARGKSAIVLVPEISLTPQLAARFRARFGDQVAVLHSGMSDRERLDEWLRLRRGHARIALGARSAIFAPVADLGVIVVDEEHDGSFKQDEGVRYHGRDVALVRAQKAGAICVLGSATPSLESYANAREGRYTLLEMPDRATPKPLPAVEILDLRKFMPDGDAMLSAPLAAAIAETLEHGDQAILFLNRRGFATFVVCRACGHAFRCPHCSVSLTYHQHADRLLCHYCGYGQRVPEVCAGCNTRGAIERKGLGTERVAEALAERFPRARVARLDRDVASGAKAEAILARVARREVDLLVGTQMVTKGHDFPGVTLVGVLCADTGLSLPDFRASERTFQLLTQVAGRAGRGDRAGRVIVQTYKPEASAVTFAARHDYAGFFEVETEERRDLGYPPHGRVVALRIDGPDPGAVAKTAERLAQLAGVIAKGAPVDVRGPAPAPLARLRGRTRWQIWLRSPDRAALRRVVRGVGTAEVASGVRVGVDVDPSSTL